jgi:membrane protein DedA with SNARE-associated domain
VATGSGVNHALHAVLTLLSCGLWLPIWVLVAIFGGSSSVAVGGAGGVIARTSNRRPLMVVAVLGGLFVLGTVADHPWLLIVLAVLGIVAGFGIWVLKSAQHREEQQRQEQFQRDMIADRADYEDRLYQEGDPRGVHGRYLPPESL